MESMMIDSFSTRQPHSTSRKESGWWYADLL